MKYFSKIFTIPGMLVVLATFIILTYLLYGISLLVPSWFY